MAVRGEEAANSKGEFQRIDSIGARRAGLIVGCEKDRDEKWPNYSRKREETRSGRRPTTERIGEGLPTRFPSNATGVEDAALVHSRALRQLILFRSTFYNQLVKQPVVTKYRRRTRRFRRGCFRVLDTWVSLQLDPSTIIASRQFPVLPIPCVIYFSFSHRNWPKFYLSPLEIVSPKHVSNINHNLENVVYFSYILNKKCMRN